MSFWNLEGLCPRNVWCYLFWWDIKICWTPCFFRAVPQLTERLAPGRCSSQLGSKQNKTRKQRRNKKLLFFSYYRFIDLFLLKRAVRVFHIFATINNADLNMLLLFSCACANIDRRLVPLRSGIAEPLVSGCSALQVREKLLFWVAMPVCTQSDPVSYKNSHWNAPSYHPEFSVFLMLSILWVWIESVCSLNVYSWLFWTPVDTLMR